MTDGRRGGVGRVVIAGVGNAYRHDDAVGAIVADRVTRADDSVQDVGPAVDPMDLLGRWDDADLAVIIDAVASRARPGTVLVWDLEAETSPTASRRTDPWHVTSSHGIDLPTALRLAGVVSHPPRRVLLVGVVGMDFSMGSGLSVAVEAAVEEAVRTVLDFVQRARSCA